MIPRVLSVILPCLYLMSSHFGVVLNNGDVHASQENRAVLAATGSGEASMSQGGDIMTISLSSTAFDNMQTIPAEFTCDGKDISPPLSWSGLPSGTKSVVVICDDPDAPVGTWVHWVCYDMPPSSTGLAKNIPKTDMIPSGGFQGITDFKRVGYGGPCPPSGTHRYFFKLYALDRLLDLAAGKSKKEIEQAMKGHILGETQLVGTYSRKRK